MKNHSTYDKHSRYDHIVVVTTMLKYVVCAKGVV